MKLSELDKQISIFPERSFSSSSDFFTYSPSMRKWQCNLCGALVVTHHGSRWAHLHNKHPEKMRKEVPA